MDVNERLTCSWLFPRPALGISNSSTSPSACVTTFTENREDLYWSDSRQWARECYQKAGRKAVPSSLMSPCTHSSLLIPLLRQSHWAMGCSRGVFSVPHSFLLILTTCPALG